MRKFTDLQKERFKHLVLDCTVQRFTTQESLQYVKDKLGIEIGVDHFNHVRLVVCVYYHIRLKV